MPSSLPFCIRRKPLFLLTLMLMICGLNTNFLAQAALEGIIVEKYYVADSADWSTMSFPVPEGATTHRIYIDLAPGWELQAIFGATNFSTGEVDTLVIRSTETFFNNSDRGRIYGYLIPTTNIDENTVLLDSWISNGRSSTLSTGVLKPADTNGALPAFPNLDGLLQNNDITAGIPVSVMDGNIPSAATTTWTTVGISSADLELFDDVNMFGNEFVESDGAFTSFTSPLSGPTADNRILVGQFTTAGHLSGKFNLQLRNSTTGVIQQWVAESPGIGQFTSPSLTWNANRLPSISLVSPIDPTYIQSGDMVHLIAEAYDPDSAVISVAFYFNDQLIDIDTLAPYTFDFSPSKSGVLKAVVSGDQFGVTSSNEVNVFVNPYRVGKREASCMETDFCLPVEIFGHGINHVIGFELHLSFDPSKVIPTGAVQPSGDLITRSYIDYDISVDLMSGKIQLAVFLNGNAPPDAMFAGSGELVCIGFEKRPAFFPGDSTIITLDTLIESFVNGPVIHDTLIPAGWYKSERESAFFGSLAFWADFSPIVYDTNHPSHFLPTTIEGYSMDCTSGSSSRVSPDVSGHFIHALDDGVHLQITRDIDPVTDMQIVINGFDALLMRKFVLDKLEFIPEVSQVIAMDVNMDGVISAGDISQVNQRTLISIDEFRQAWNYDVNGNPIAGFPSKDWHFVSGAELETHPAYQRSSVFPDDNGRGYSRHRVPVPGFCSWTGVDDSPAACPEDVYDVFIGILLGDVNGNYKSIPPDGVIK